MRGPLQVVEALRAHTAHVQLEADSKASALLKDCDEVTRALSTAQGEAQSAAASHEAECSRLRATIASMRKIEVQQ